MPGTSAESAAPPRIAPPDSTAPVSMPEIAPRAVRPRHQIPRMSMGHSVDAVNANTRPTLPARPVDSVASATTSGTNDEMTAAMRKPRTLPPRRSWLITPASETTSPDEVERNAANAPAMTSAVSTSPSGPGTSRSGSSRMSASDSPGAARSGAKARPRKPNAVGNR